MGFTSELDISKYPAELKVVAVICKFSNFFNN